MAANKTEIAYFEARLTESLKCAARAAGQCSKAAHAGLARLYRLELMELRNCSDIALSGTALVSHQTSGILEGASAFSSWSNGDNQSMIVSHQAKSFAPLYAQVR